MTVPTVAMVWNAPLVVFRIIFDTKFIPSIVFHTLGLSIGFVYSIAIVIQNQHLRTAVCDVLNLCGNYGSKRISSNDSHENLDYEVTGDNTLNKPLKSDFRHHRYILK